MLQHAELTLRAGEIYITALLGADLRINNVIGQGGKVCSGDVVKLGPYELEIGRPELNDGFGIASESLPHHEFILSIVLVDPLGDDLHHLIKQSRVDVDRIGLSIRGWSALLAGAVFVLSFALPFLLNLWHTTPDLHTLTQAHVLPAPAPTRIWSSGPISTAHKFFGVACESCHQKAFLPVGYAACLTCHGRMQEHSMPGVSPTASSSGEACAACHKEHRGETFITLKDQDFCTSCHADITHAAQHKVLRDVSDFGTNHPQFRPTVMTDPATRATDRSRESGATPPPVEANGLNFSHAKHLRAAVRNPVRGMVDLQCADCHTPVAGGQSMKPITFEDTCHQCHVLKFDALVPDRELIHGRAEVVLNQVRDVYDAIALRGGYNEPAAPQVVRRRPGAPLNDPEKQVVSDWAASKSTEVFNGRFGKGLCAECHMLTTITGLENPGLNWNVTPVGISTHYLRKSFFNHARHQDVACATCHEATASMAASDVIIPGLAVCHGCHGGEASNDRVPSTCVTCHRFHRQDLPTMGQPTNAESGQ